MRHHSNLEDGKGIQTISKNQLPLKYLFNLIPQKLNSFQHPTNYSVMCCRNNYFKNSFIPNVARESSKLSPEIGNITLNKWLKIFH